jgi:hypothetical protein
VLVAVVRRIAALHEGRPQKENHARGIMRSPLSDIEIRPAIGTGLRLA